jgi:hypothetical protein
MTENEWYEQNTEHLSLVEIAFGKQDDKMDANFPSAFPDGMTPLIAISDVRSIELVSLALTGLSNEMMEHHCGSLSCQSRVIDDLEKILALLTACRNEHERVVSEASDTPSEHHE